MIAAHPWMLVAPWYRWQRQLAEESLTPRRTRPVFQKFDRSDFAKEFTRDPQRSLRFLGQVDRVYNVHSSPATKLGGKFARLYAPKPREPGKPKSDERLISSLVPTGLRKLYLDIHKRYYLVVCELHCDAPGFPAVTPDQACQGGLVVRRRSFAFPANAKREATELLRKIVGLQVDVAHLDESAPAKGAALLKRAKAIEKLRAEGAYGAALAQARTKLAEARAELRKWKDEKGVAAVLEGWVHGPFANIGAWQIVDETPQALVESSFPLYPLFPDPNIADHSARGKTIYFGVVPTSSLDTDANGNARFDDDSLYEIRCFVRRHDPHCPRRDRAPDCHGELVWSAPSESYKLAAPGDLLGSAQRPITIQVPDLNELAAQAGALPIDTLAPVKVVQPQGLNFSIDDGKPSGGSVGSKQVCFFALPLITIVAVFLFKLFLPILVFLFGLFFLLRLKLCIPPSLEIAAGLDAELKALPPSLDVDADFSVDIGGGVFLTDEQLHADLKQSVAAETGMTGAQLDGLDDFSNAALLPLGQSIAVAGNISVGAAARAGLDLTAQLEFEPRIEVQAGLV